MIQNIISKCLVISGLLLVLSACTPDLKVKKSEDTSMIPASYYGSQDTVNTARQNWKEYFSDPNLIALIDTALSNNQELNITLQEIEIARNEVMARKSEYLPSIGLRAGAEIEKSGRYTRYGALEANNEIKPGENFQSPFLIICLVQ